jgi:phosphoglycolate phosphatase
MASYGPATVTGCSGEPESVAGQFRQPRSFAVCTSIMYRRSWSLCTRPYALGRATVGESMTDVTSEASLILWDIDCTLVDIGVVSQEIYAKAFFDVTKRPLQELADMTGRTEKSILIDTLALHGVADPDAKFEEFYAALAVAADELREKMHSKGRRLPGTQEAITALARDGVVQTVVTGNIKPIAITKLEVFGLTKHIDFEVGGYGSDDSTRSILVRLAWQRAERKYDRRFVPDRVVVIGDTPHDMQAAHDLGVHAVGVATGSSTVEELVTAHADVVVDSLIDTERFVAAVFQHVRQE